MKKLLAMATIAMAALASVPSHAEEGTYTVLFTTAGYANYATPFSYFSPFAPPVGPSPKGCLQETPGGSKSPEKSCEKVAPSRHHRCLYLKGNELGDTKLAQDNATKTGKFGYLLNIASAQRGDGFTLRDASGLPSTLPNGGAIDWEITFFDDLGTCESLGRPGGVDTGFPAATVSPGGDFNRLGNEAGTVPLTAKFAIVVGIGANPAGSSKFTFNT